MAGLIDPSFLTKNRPKIGNPADRAMMGPSPVRMTASRYPATGQAPPAPYQGKVAGTSQALTAAPAFDVDAWAQNDWSTPVAPVAPAAPTPPSIASFGKGPPWVQRAREHAAKINAAIAENNAQQPDFALRSTPPSPEVAVTSAPEPVPIDWNAWAETPWWPGEVTPSQVPGLLETPGKGETYPEENPLPAARDPQMVALVDQLMKYGGLGERDFSKYYDNAWKHASSDISDVYAGHGMGNSSDALRGLGHARTDLAAQQSKDEAEFALESLKNDIGRYGIAGNLLGKLTDQDFERWDLGHGAAVDAQKLMEGRLRGGLSDISQESAGLIRTVLGQFGSMTENDQKLALEAINNLVASSSEELNQEAGRMSESAGSLAALQKLAAGIKTPATKPAAGK